MNAGKAGIAAVVMGVSGSGKTTVGQALAEWIHAAFVEGDDLHPPANRQKMASGTALQDADRWPWLDAIGRQIAISFEEHGSVIAACSALKRRYRQRLAAASGLPLSFVLLHGDRHILGERLAARRGHFMPASLLDSQLSTLELPGRDESSIILNIAEPPASLVGQAADFLRMPFANANNTENPR